MTARAGKTRNIILVWLVWPLLTLGIYFFVWWYKVNREARDFDERIVVNPTMSMLAMLLGWVIIVPPFVTAYTTGERIGQMQQAAGMERTCNGWIGVVLFIVLGLEPLYYQMELNKIWARFGYPEEGAVLSVSAGQAASG